MDSTTDPTCSHDVSSTDTISEDELSPDSNEASCLSENILSETDSVSTQDSVIQRRTNEAESNSYIDEILNDSDKSSESANSDCEQFDEEDVGTLSDSNNENQVDEQENEQSPPFHSLLAEWAASSCISHTTIDCLLAICRTQHWDENLPISCRILLKSPRIVHLKIIASSTYYHLGLLSSLLKN